MNLLKEFLGQFPELTTEEGTLLLDKLVIQTFEKGSYLLQLGEIPAFFFLS